MPPMPGGKLGGKVGVLTATKAICGLRLSTTIECAEMPLKTSVPVKVQVLPPSVDTRTPKPVVPLSASPSAA